MQNVNETRLKLIKCLIIQCFEGGISYAKVEVMQVFRIFSKMLGSMPAPAVLEALDAECRMLEDDVAHHRLNWTEDTLSILCFRGFLQMVKWGDVMRCSLRLPPDHTEFYKDITLRLVNAGELPGTALEQFDYAFKRKN